VKGTFFFTRVIFFQLDALSKSHPYNPLWAQLGELYGALGFPVKVAKTVVTSGAKKLDLLNRILNSMTYFIRCSEVEKLVIENQGSSDEQPDETDATIIKKSKSTSTTTLLNEDLFPAQSSLTRHFLSGHDVMTVFDDRVDHGVEIGRELGTENGACQFPDKCSENVGTKSGSPPSEATKDHCNSVQKVGGTGDCNCSSIQKSVPLGQSSVEGGSGMGARNSGYLSAPQVSGMRRTASFMKRLDSTTTVTDLEHWDSKSSTRTGQLYPSLADLNLVGDGNETQNSNISLHPTHDSSVADFQVSEFNNIKSYFSFSHEDISQKVSRLCRVPTSAILYHLQSDDSGEESKAEEMLLPKRVECERQRSSVRTAPAFKAKPVEASENSKSPPSVPYTAACGRNTVTSISEGSEDRSGKGDVIFVIGDNEQLVDLKQSHKFESDHNEKVANESLGCDACDDRSVPNASSLRYSPVIIREGGAPLGSRSSITVSCLASDVKSPCEHKCDSTNRFKLNLNLGSRSCKFQEDPVNIPAKEGGRRQLTACSTSANGPRVITVHPSVIELEDECSELETCLSVKSALVRTSRPVSRSLSLLSPLSGENVAKKELYLCRRHSDCVSEITRYLKDYHSVRFHFERCEGVLRNYIQGRVQKKNLDQTDKKTVKVAEARGNFCLSENCVVCEKYSSVSKNALGVGCSVSKSLVDKTSDSCDTSVTRGETRSGCISGYTSEGNAIFDDYSNLSDDDILCDDSTARQKAEDDGITSAEQQRCDLLLELSMPRLV
jgi:hypothetical protein